MPSETTIVEYPRRPLKASRTRVTRKVVSKAKKKSKRPQRAKLVKELDAVFSLYIRTKFAAKDGSLKCYTCPKMGTVKTMQNGHYVTRSIRALRWDEQNCRPQCYGCNVMHGGNPITFRENLVQEYGEKAVKELEAKRHELFTPTDEWLQEQIMHYTTLTKSLTNVE